MFQVMVGAGAFSFAYLCASLLRYVVLRRAVSKNAADWLSGLVALEAIVVGTELRVWFDPNGLHGADTLVTVVAAVVAFSFSRGMLKEANKEMPLEPPSK